MRTECFEHLTRAIISHAKKNYVYFKISFAQVKYSVGSCDGKIHLHKQTLACIQRERKTEKEELKYVIDVVAVVWIFDSFE